MKVMDEIVLIDWVDRIVAPAELKLDLEGHIPDKLREKVIYVVNDCTDMI